MIGGSRRMGLRGFCTLMVGFGLSMLWLAVALPLLGPPGGPFQPEHVLIVILGVLLITVLVFTPAWVRVLLMRRALRRLVEARGLALVPCSTWWFQRCDEAAGWVQGVPLRIQARGVRDADNQLRRTVIDVASPHFDLGFEIASRSVLGRLWRHLGGGERPTHDDAFDHRFVTEAPERQRLDALLDAELRAFLLSLPNAWTLHATHLGMELRRGGWHFGASTCDMLDWAARLHHLLSLKRHQSPPAHALQAHAEAWARIARRHGLSFTHSPLAAWGGLDGVMTSAYAELAGHAPCLRFASGYPMALPFSLEVVPEHTVLDARAIDRKAVVLGHATFDARFRVRADRPDLAVRALLPVADALVRLSTLGFVSISNTGVALLEHTPSYPASLERTLHELTRIARRLHDGIFAGHETRHAYR